jgi:flagella basal body P-ring formation protein FlgA
MTRALMTFIFVILLGGPVQADQPAPLTGAEIAARVRATLVENGQQGVPILAEQRRYYPCEVDLAISPRREGRWDAVDVACPGQVPWSIVVRTSAEVPAGFSFGGRETSSETTSVVVFRHTVRRDEVITADKLEVIEMVRAPASGTFSEIAPLVGRRMVQTLGAGVPVRERHLEMEWAVREGEPVAIESVSGEMVISMAGIALEDGQIGDFIEVQNLRSRKTLHGIVADGKKIVVSPNRN